MSYRSAALCFVCGDAIYRTVTCCRASDRTRIPSRNCKSVAPFDEGTVVSITYYCWMLTLGVYRTAYQSSVRFGNGMSKILRNRFGIWNLTNSAERFGIYVRLRHPRKETLWNGRAAGGQHCWTFTSFSGSLPWADFFGIPEIVRYGTVRFLKLSFLNRTYFGIP